jgi:ketosteroid isomerase-like protein
MRSIIGVVAFGFVVGCGGAENEQQPVQAPPPPPPPVVTAPPAPPPEPPPPPKPSMAEMQQAAIKTLVASVNDAGKLMALYAPDAVVVTPGFPETKGREAIQKGLQEWIAANANLATAPVRMWSKGNVLAVEFVTTATDKATGKPWGVDGLDLLTFNDDGLVIKDHTYVDAVTILKQTGAHKGQTPGRPVLSLPTSAPEMHVSRGDATEDANIASENALNAAWSKMDDKAALAMISDDAAMNDYTDDQPRDKKWMKEVWVAVKKSMKDSTWKDWSLFGVEDFTIDEGEYSFTQTGDFVHGKVHIPSKKKTITGHNVEIDQWKDGKIVRSWNWSNEMEFDMQLGIGPAAPKPAPKKDAKKP